MNNNQDTWMFLPPEHRPGGKRGLHDDYPWPFSLVPRTWTSFVITRPPRMVAGNQRYWCHFDSGMVSHEKKPDPIKEWGPKPVPDWGWQFSMLELVDPETFKAFRRPYFAIKIRWLKLHFRIGARWTDPAVDSPWNYVTYPSIAIKRFK